MMMNEPRFTRLQQSLHQGFTLDLKAIFKEAWTRIQGAHLSLFLAALGVALCYLVLSQLAYSWVANNYPAEMAAITAPITATDRVDPGRSVILADADQADANQTDADQTDADQIRSAPPAGDAVAELPKIPAPLLLLNLLVSIVLTPMWVSLTMIGIERSVNRAIHPSQILHYFRFLLPLTVAFLWKGLLSVLVMILSMLVLQMLGLTPFLALPVLVLLNVALMFTFPLIIEKGLTPRQAIVTSLKLFRRQWQALLLFQICMWVLVIITVMSYFILFIWAAPLLMLANGIIYREVCGVEGQHYDDANNNHGHGSGGTHFQPSTSLNANKDNFEA